MYLPLGVNCTLAAIEILAVYLGTNCPGFETKRRNTIHTILTLQRSGEGKDEGKKERKGWGKGRI